MYYHYCKGLPRLPAPAAGPLHRPPRGAQHYSYRNIVYLSPYSML